MSKPPPPKGEASFRALPRVCQFVSRESRTACLKLWAGKRMLALSALLVTSHLPQRGRRASAPYRGFAGLFHVKHGLVWPKPWAGTSAYPLQIACRKPPPPKEEASFRALPWVCQFVSRESRTACLKLWAGKRALTLSGLPMASHLPQRGRRVSAPCRGFAGLFHVKRKRQRSFRLAASPVGNE